MTQKKLEVIYDLLGKLHGYAYFRPQDGPLRERLTETVLDAMSGDVAEELAHNPFDLEVNIGSQEGDSETSLGFSVDYPGVVYRSQLALTSLSEPELEDLAKYLVLEEQETPPAAATGASKTLVRKKETEGDYLEKGPASGRLKVTPEWLKSVIPCTDYSYEEIDGKKYIREYYWSKDLIERLFRIKSSKTTPEDLQYVAAECCDGDLDWAKDLIARLKSPNRPEPGPREQAQKGQGKMATVKVAQKQVQGKPLQPKPSPGKGAHPAAAAAGSTPGGAPAATAAAGERGRGRSRHKRPFRDHGKDSGRKPDPSGGQKQPQQ